MRTLRGCAHLGDITLHIDPTSKQPSMDTPTVNDVIVLLSFNHNKNKLIFFYGLLVNKVSVAGLAAQSFGLHTLPTILLASIICYVDRK